MKKPLAGTLLWGLVTFGCGPTVPPDGREAADRDAKTTFPEPDAGLPTPNLDAILELGCATETVVSSLLPTNLLFVIDRSSSMRCNPPPTTASSACAERQEDLNALTKWQIIRAEIMRAVRALPPETGVGISFFNNDTGCGAQRAPRVPIARLDALQLDAISASLNAVEPEGSTPLVGATTLAYEHLHQAALRGEIRGNKFVVLITDGEESDSCRDESQCQDAAQCTSLLVDETAPKAAMPGVNIRTFAIGAPGSEAAREVLSRLAVLGQTAPAGCNPADGNCHFDMTAEPDFSRALRDALDSIGGRATLSCELPPPDDPDGGPIDLDRVNVIFSPGDGSEPELVRQDPRAGCDQVEGWQYSPNEDRILLCGPICDRVKADLGGRIDVVLGCPIVGPE